jgi:hypothetical protein
MATNKNKLPQSIQLMSIRWFKFMQYSVGFKVNVTGIQESLFGYSLWRKGENRALESNYIIGTSEIDD